MTTYPIGHPVHWDSSTPRKGAQTGVLSREWERYSAFPWVQWDGEMAGQECLPECIEPLEQGETKQASGKTAWEDYKKVGIVR